MGMIAQGLFTFFEIFIRILQDELSDGEVV